MTTTQTNDTSNSNESLSDKNNATSQGAPAGVGETPEMDADLWLAGLLFPAMYGGGML